MMLGNCRDCADERVQNCLQTLHLRRVDAMERGIVQCTCSNRTLNEQLRWLLCTRNL